MINVLITDDHRLVRQGLNQILSSEPDINVVGEAADGEEACLKVRLLKPDVVLMDISMPGMNGVEATLLLKASAPETSVIILTMHQREDLVFQALKAGAKGYFLKETDSQELIEAIRLIHAGGVMLDSDIANQLIEEFRRLKEPGEHEEVLHLTARERDILELLSQGADNARIAKALSISEKTVRNRLSGIFDKLHVNNRTEAALFAQKEKISPFNP
jgi:DNA-binding NarL/FixJ family response regulator